MHTKDYPVSYNSNENVFHKLQLSNIVWIPFSRIKIKNLTRELEWVEF